LITSLEIDSVTQNGVRLNFEHANNLVKATLSRSLNSGELDSITLFYKGIPESLTGFGSFETNFHEGTPVLWTLSEPYGAREWWPCKQSLSDKIDSLDLYVETPSQYKVGSNGKLIFEKTEGDLKQTYWKHRYPIASYLVAIAVTNYESYSHYAMVNEIDSVEILNYVYPENVASAKEDTKFTVDVIELFSKLFIPYPFYKEKYGHAQFGWGGGMEHQTMSFMGGFSESLITHELAHQWFGDYVTCGSWQHIWINEGFAVFCECLAQEHLNSENWTSWKKERMNTVLNNAQSGSIFVDDTTDVSRIFNYALTYQKGGLILQMLRTQIGDTPFFEGINKMLSQSENGGAFATADDVQYLLEAAADTTLTEFFNDWYYGEGYPLYKISWEQDLNKQLHFNVSQTTTHSSVPFFELSIPILLIGDNKEQLVYLHNTSNNQTYSLSADFAVNEIVFDPYYNIIANHPAEISLNINETLATNNDLIFMPNPANETLTVKSLKGIEFSKIDIINVSGKHVFNKIYEKRSHKTNLNISKLPAGIYYVRVDTNKGLIVKQIVKTN
jgi:aminopeptidase N